jgi:glyoxylase-like metal-dependent hydrolase (beta-lactamase superfamily II)
MVDAPRWVGRVREWFEREGGLAHVLLTHQDDVADAGRYAAHFGARVWIHEDDRDAAPFATDVLTAAETLVVEGLRAIHAPGHTKGSVLYHLASPPHAEAPVLFGGDTIAWDRGRQRLVAFRDACWYSWDVLKASLTALARSEHRFAHCFAGHGGSVSSDVATLHAALEALVRRM